MGSTPGLAYLSSDGSSPDVEMLQRSGMVAFDAETTSTDINRTRLLGISAANNSRSAYFFPAGYPDWPGRLLADDAIPKIAHNAIFDRSVLKQHGIIVNNIIDTMIAAHLVGESVLNLKSLSARWLSMKVTSHDELKKPMSQLTLDELCDYSGPHSIAAWLLWQELEPMLRHWGSYDIFHELEMPLVPVLSDMELNGAMIDADELRVLGDVFEGKAKVINGALDYHSGTKGINWNSGDQVARILFEELGLPPGPLTKSGKRYSTDVHVLDTLKGKHPVVNLILQYRQYRKLKDTYVDSILDKMVDGRIYTNFNQTGTRTGRLSSTNPNLQNIPMRRPEGRRIRKAFIAPPGCLLVKPDYEQLELRYMAHRSQDRRMIEAFLNEEDIHLKTALEVFGSADRRFDGKTLNFSTGYGGGDKLIAEQTGMPLAEARKWRKRYFEIYSGLDHWIKAERQHCRECGYARTMHGRVRVIPEFDEMATVEHGYREAISTIIQGSSSEIVKLGMIEAWKVLKDTDVKMILQVHDEVLFEVPEAILRDVVEFLGEVLPYNELSVPIPVTISVGKDWRDMEAPIWDS